MSCSVFCKGATDCRVFPERNTPWWQSPAQSDDVDIRHPLLFWWHSEYENMHCNHCSLERILASWPVFTARWIINPQQLLLTLCVAAGSLMLCPILKESILIFDVVIVFCVSWYFVDKVVSNWILITSSALLPVDSSSDQRDRNCVHVK